MFLYVGLLGFVVVAYLSVYAITMVFSNRIFQNWDLGIEWVLRSKAMELESLRCIVSCLEIVVVVRYALFSWETQSPKGHLNVYIYMMFVQTRNSAEREVLMEIIRLEVLNLL